MPEADFSFAPEYPTEQFDEVIFTNQSKGNDQNEWLWFFNTDPLTTASGPEARTTFKDAGSYAVAMSVKNQWGCGDTITRVINVMPDFHVYVPDAFTPDGDHINEVFKPVGRGVKFYYLSIYNRWGEKIFESKDIETGWDGTYKGERCKADVYTWKINASGVDGSQKLLNGHVSLLR